MLEHVDDRRLTLCVVRPWDGSATYIPQVGELVSNLVQQLAGDEGLDWTRTPDGNFLSAQTVAAWWRRAQDVGEENYLVENVIPRAAQVSKLYAAMLVLLADKYPNRLPEIYRRSLLERPDLSTTGLAAEIVAKLDADVAIDLLADGAAHAQIARQVEALEALAGLNATRFEARLVAALARMPAQTTGRYADAEQIDLARLCLKSGADEVWSALRQATSRADVGIRLEILDALGRSSPPSYDLRKRIVSFLASFLEDATIRDTAENPTKYEGSAGGQRSKLEVRNWAAYRLADLLGVDVSSFRGDKPVGDLQWQSLRKAVESERNNP